MTISGSMGIYGLGNYRISSIQGNPYSMNPIQKIGRNSDKAGKPLVLAAKEPKEDLYVKEFGELGSIKNTATGDFAEMLSIQEDMLEDETPQQQDHYAGYLNDTIGMMGYQNHLRDQLNGVGFTPFT